VYYTDGSVDTYTGNAAAAFIHKEATAHFRLPDGSSTLQTELVAIMKALQHAELRQRPVVIHSDSLGAIQALQKSRPRDNVGLITAILTTAHNIQGRGRSIHLNWIPSHVGIEGNEAADLAAKNALSLPNVTVPVPASLSMIRAKLKKASSGVSKKQLRHWASQGSPSANWFTITNMNTTPFPENLHRKTRNNLHRLRLGYKCLEELKRNTPTECAHCNTDTTSLLLHYVEECPETQHHLDRSLGTAPEIIAKTPHQTLAELVRRKPPPR